MSSIINKLPVDMQEKVQAKLAQLNTIELCLQYMEELNGNGTNSAKIMVQILRDHMVSKWPTMRKLIYAGGREVNDRRDEGLYNISQAQELISSLGAGTRGLTTFLRMEELKDENGNLVGYSFRK